MANTIKLKRSGTASQTPSSLEYGELAINYADGKLFYKNSSNSIVEFSSNNGGGASSLDGLNDVTAGSPSSGDFLKYNGSAWVNDAINLGTDTIGDYVASLVAGTGISLSNNSGEGSTPTISLTNSSVTINGQSISLGSSGTVTAAAGTLTGTTLNSTVVGSSLTSVGTLSSLTVSGNVTASQYYGRARDTEIRFFMEVI